MNTIVEIDKAGRIVVPKKFRDALHLTPGTRLRVHRSGDALTLEPSSPEARLVIKDGLPLIIPFDMENAPVRSVEFFNQILEQTRAERDHYNLGLSESGPGLDEA